MDSAFAGLEEGRNVGGGFWSWGGVGEGKEEEEGGERGVRGCMVNGEKGWVGRVGREYWPEYSKGGY